MHQLELFEIKREREIREIGALGWRVGVIGATGLVGELLLTLLKERGFPIKELRLFASHSSPRRYVETPWGEWEVESLEGWEGSGVDLVFLAVESDIARRWGWRLARRGVLVIDKSSYFRLKPSVPLVVPEVNGELLTTHKGIVASPNCTVIPLVMACSPLHRYYGIRWLVVTSLQSVSGAGRRAVEVLTSELKGVKLLESPFPQPIAHNLIPWIGRRHPSFHSDEEIKIILETRKILGIPKLPVMATAVRVPIFRVHTLAVHCELQRKFDLKEVIDLWRNSPGLRLADDPLKGEFPTPKISQDNDWVWVGRIRRDRGQKGLGFFLACDNLRKGAATNAIQIAEQMIGQSRGAEERLGGERAPIATIENTSDHL